MIKFKIVDFSSESVPNMIRDILTENFVDVEECDTPDFLFYSAFGYEHLNYNCVRIFWTGENIFPDFNICDYAIGFAYLEFADRYKRVPLYHFYKDDYLLAKSKHQNVSDTLLNRKFCSFVYSNGTNSDPIRERFFNELSKYKTVDSGGRYLNNIGGPVEDKIDFQRQYKFSIAFENCASEGYTTEKLIQAFASQTIPIYWGDPRVSEVFNEDAFVDVSKFSSIEEALARVKEIDCNDEMYLKMLKCPMERVNSANKSSFDDFKNFIVYICSQNVKSAFRRSLYGWGLVNEKSKRTEREIIEKASIECAEEKGISRIAKAMLRRIGWRD